MRPRRILRGAARVFAAVLVAGVLLVTLLGAYAMWMPESSYRGPLPEMTDRQQQLEGGLYAHVERLAAEIGPRYAGRPDAYREAADYLRDTLEGFGYEPASREFEYRGQTFENIEAQVLGQERPEEVVVVGAHYDTAGPTPGADDNASGVAAVLELARLMRDSRPERTLRFVLFANEEAPYFNSEAMGSRVYARRARQRGEDIVVMMSLEMLGYYSDRPSSQEYPLFLGRFYPVKADFIGFVANLSNRDAVARSIEAFRKNTKFPSEGLAAPGFVPGVSLSDHWAFWQEDYPALMVTDTAFFRNPNYHRPTDTAETLDYERFARVVDGLVAVVEAWAQ